MFRRKSAKITQKGGNCTIKKGGIFLLPTIFYMCIRCGIWCRLWFCHQIWPNFIFWLFYGHLQFCSEGENRIDPPESATYLNHSVNLSYRCGCNAYIQLIRFRREWSGRVKVRGDDQLHPILFRHFCRETKLSVTYPFFQFFPADAHMAKSTKWELMCAMRMCGVTSTNNNQAFRIVSAKIFHMINIHYWLQR